MIDTLIGRRCRAIRCFRHRLGDEPLGEAGPIEFTWDDDTLLTLDANADWTLQLSSRPWTDPFSAASPSERIDLRERVGLWHEVPTPQALLQVLGQAVRAVAPEFNEAGELAGLIVTFDEQVVRARVLGGEITVEVSDR